MATDRLASAGLAAGTSSDGLVAAITRIPFGRVRTFVDLAPGAPWRVSRIVRVDRPDGVPWWRAVRADGALPGGPEQRDRLAGEGVVFRPGARPRVDLRLSRELGGTALSPEALQR